MTIAVYLLDITDRLEEFSGIDLATSVAKLPSCSQRKDMNSYLELNTRQRS